jgi:hypothetical protein
MKVIIAGSRDFNDYNLLKNNCDVLLSLTKENIEIVSGGARGADSLGERYAQENNLELKIFPADWSIGKGAGFIRNKQMADYSDALIAFWDGKSKGTKMMIDLAKKNELKS